MTHAQGSIRGWGYEGKSIEDLICEAERVHADVVVDVRMTPISRKKGFSKTRLREALEAAGLSYVHMRELGNPKDNRAAFATPGTAAAARAYQRFTDEVLHTPEGTAAVHYIADLATNQTVLVLCFEHYHEQCHRRLVIDEVTAVLAEHQNSVG
ncbi:DUF488 domain-containing protein [Actinobaculum sp. 352]|uniref:DUF488 domain-containing protein n=1 Tax=Actinobaculum sp. 352 TaxID=2490946 RepID=UPI000F7E5AB9|nr:DUF488 domain-containing protein [Actinobaculum sp. 352]RTE49186.1 DUF488 domain-containing protein [Actinobaculum sp. 352]